MERLGSLQLSVAQGAGRGGKRVTRLYATGRGGARKGGGGVLKGAAPENEATLQRRCCWRGLQVTMVEKILVTGGAGYIGSHCVLELVEAGYAPVVIDNFHNAIQGSNMVPESIRRVEEIVGKEIPFQKLDVLDEAGLRELFKKHCFSAVIHFAGLKAVGESVQIPLEYYKVNLTGTIQLLEVMKAHGVKDIVFSSSATVYGDPAYLPLDEKHPVGGCTNPYGKSKYFIEEMIQDLCKAEPVAVGRREYLNVFGNDYSTVDGTGVRDYIHVVDLAKGHIAALKKLKENCGCKIKYKVVARREGDIASCFANPALAEKELGWKAVFDLDKMCK
ncbi:hypothetical protein JD844_005292 [Phrynosoma platyrhinos]|uniref:UDP-glucose 4-epimerase n=1 Tax=Phrynosoma platyrhinos TaxID=52577 RepID=A0ABQ7TMW1_PHRPL|nr:hypothetical protein JD844_005292 [Phrynosoma platyrhinos]